MPFGLRANVLSGPLLQRRPARYTTARPGRSVAVRAVPAHPPAAGKRDRKRRSAADGTDRRNRPRPQIQIQIQIQREASCGGSMTGTGGRPASGSAGCGFPERRKLESATLTNRSKRQVRDSLCERIHRNPGTTTTPSGTSGCGGRRRRNAATDDTIGKQPSDQKGSRTSRRTYKKRRRRK